MEHWTRILDNGNDVDIIYLYFRKAFDCVPHQCLLSKLKAYVWLVVFLTGSLTFYQIDDKE